jgi:ribonuclease P protein component
MIAKNMRFHGYGSLRYLYNNGGAARSRLFIVKTVANQHRQSSRLAVVVSKKVHKGAVGRNRIRRRIYEALRHELPTMTGVYDIAVIVTSGETITAESVEIKSLLHDLLKQTGVVA